FDADRERYGVAVLGQRRQLELDPLLRDRGRPDDLPDRVLRLLRSRVSGHDRDDRAEAESDRGTYQELATRGLAVHQSFSVVKTAPTSSICSAVRIGLSRHAGATRVSPSIR